MCMSMNLKCTVFRTPEACDTLFAEMKGLYDAFENFFQSYGMCLLSRFSSITRCMILIIGNNPLKRLSSGTSKILTFPPAAND